MNEKFFIGVLLGMVGGAAIVANFKTAGQMVRDGERKIKQKITQAVKKK